MTINDGVAPPSGSVQCSLVEQGMVTISDGLEPASGSAQCFLLESGTSTIGEGVAPPLLLLDLVFFCCEPARPGSSDLRLILRVEGAIIFTRTDTVVIVVYREKQEREVSKKNCVSLWIQYMWSKFACKT